MIWINMCLSLFLAASSVSAEEWQHEVLYNDMATGTVLPEGDQMYIVVEPHNSTDPCLAMNDDEVAIEMNFGELVSMWKQVTLNLFEDPDQYRVIIEMIGNQNSYITIFNLYELLNYRLCFWKDDGDIFNPRRNHYMMIDASTNLLPKHLYKFFWVRDDL